MKEYIAKHFVHVGKTVYTPGEIFPAEIEKEDEERLLRVGAVEVLTQQTASRIETAENIADESEPENTAEETEPEETVVPEIDVMAGISTAKKTTRRKSK